MGEKINFPKVGPGFQVKREEPPRINPDAPLGIEGTMEDREKFLKRYMKDNFGIKKDGPLDPEYLVDEMKGAEEYAKARRASADRSEAELDLAANPEARKISEAYIEDARHVANVALHGTKADIDRYVHKKENYAAYYDMAKAEDDARSARQEAA